MLTNTTDVILHGNGSLVLHNVGAEDSGNYACIAENGDLSIMTDAQVNVKSKFVASARVLFKSAVQALVRLLDSFSLRLSHFQSF